ncbi:hypothetical protein EG68_07522 [Paragonimus skrjabini miyazakii]|uniref:Uncharacterized protein n=1 Tax=Paragonimus skrjabini miyazakii TaxID=59628 RepID=A0A8S9YM52_9TREM|nr:hypothetical protein EG68_07522 [Paragonimus skrjabini miyazakii]
MPQPDKLFKWTSYPTDRRNLNLPAADWTNDLTLGERSLKELCHNVPVSDRRCEVPVYAPTQPVQDIQQKFAAVFKDGLDRHMKTKASAARSPPQDPFSDSDDLFLMRYWSSSIMKLIKTLKHVPTRTNEYRLHIR